MYNSYERKQHEMETESFRHEKETLLESLKEEKRKVGEDKMKGMKEIEKMKTELMNQRREVNKEKQMYYIHKEPRNLDHLDLNVILFE